MNIKIIAIFLSVVTWAYADEYIHRAAPCCKYEGGQWYVGGHHQEWWNQNYPGSWQKFGLNAEWNPQTSFSDISEQPEISGFERGVYNSPK